MSSLCEGGWRIIDKKWRAARQPLFDCEQKTKDMFLLNLLEAKAVFLLMVFLLIVIPVWILLVAFTKKKGKADNVDAPGDAEDKSESVEKSEEEDAEAV